MKNREPTVLIVLHHRTSNKSEHLNSSAVAGMTKQGKIPGSRFSIIHPYTCSREEKN
jgi:hypothetical protein